MSEIIVPRGNLVDRLRDCLTWCQSRNVSDELDPTTAYRSSELAGCAYRALRDDAGPLSDSGFSAFLGWRKKLSKHLPPVSENAVLRELKRPNSLLLCADNQSVIDGACEPVSAGYINENDAPPWDTWVDLGKGSSGTKYLISWVPSWAIKYVDAAISVNCIAMLAWGRYSDGHLEHVDPEEK